jgi:hypothetical protein
MTKDQKNEVIEVLKGKFSQYNNFLCYKYRIPFSCTGKQAASHLFQQKC